MDFFKKLASNVLDDQENFTDLTQVAVVDADACVTVLSRRFEANAVYTHCGPLLVAVNPYQYIPELYSDEQLEDAVAIMEGMKPKAEWDNMQSLTAQLGNLTNYMNRLEGKMTDQEEAQAIADRVLAEEAAANGEGGDPAAADQGGDGGAPADGDPAPAPEPQVEPATEADEVASEDLPVPKELMEQLNVLRARRSTSRRSSNSSWRSGRCRRSRRRDFPPRLSRRR